MFLPISAIALSLDSNRPFDEVQVAELHAQCLRESDAGKGEQQKQRKITQGPEVTDALTDPLGVPALEDLVLQVLDDAGDLQLVQDRLLGR